MSIYYNGVVNNMLENEIIIPELTKEELKEISRSKKSTSQIWATNKGGRTSLLLSHYINLKLNKIIKLNREELNSVMSKKSTSSWGRY